MNCRWRGEGHQHSSSNAWFLPVVVPSNSLEWGKQFLQNIEPQSQLRSLALFQNSLNGMEALTIENGAITTAICMLAFGPQKAIYKSNQ